MSCGKKRKHKSPKRFGHYCWACDSYRANERFSGKGHQRNLCRGCAKLGADELEYRQALRNLERCVTWKGIIRRKKRQEFQRYLNSANVRIRSVALEIQAEDTLARALYRMGYDLEDSVLASIGKNNESQAAPSDTPCSDSIPF